MLRFSVPSSGIQIVLDAPVFATLIRCRQRHLWQRERGGLLFADLHGKSSSEVLISEATPPHPEDRATRYGLALDHKRCTTEVVDANARDLIFVGYWHTHPEKTPQISGQDVSSFYDNLRQGGHGLSKLLAIIVGQRNDAKGIAAYLVAGGAAEQLAAVTSHLEETLATRVP